MGSVHAGEHCGLKAIVRLAVA